MFWPREPKEAQKKPACDLKSAHYAKKRDRDAGNTMAKGMLTNINQFREATGQEQNPMPDDGSICEIRAAVAATVLHVLPGETLAAMLDSANSSAVFIKRASVTKTLAGSMQVPLDGVGCVSRGMLGWQQTLSCIPPAHEFHSSPRPKSDDMLLTKQQQ